MTERLVEISRDRLAELTAHTSGYADDEVLLDGTRVADFRSELGTLSIRDEIQEQPHTEQAAIAQRLAQVAQGQIRIFS